MSRCMPVHVQVVIKSQVLAGGRGLGTFKNGFQGGVHITTPDKIPSIAGVLGLPLPSCTVLHGLHRC